MNAHVADNNIAGNRRYFDSPAELLAVIERVVKKTEVVLDIGCGIMPMNHFRPKLHLLVEPWKEYSDILASRHAGDKSVVIIRAGALEALRQLADNSVDSIFLLDVIEHLEKEEGRLVVIESERVAREQIVIFTPLGFMPQHMEGGQADGWGLGGGAVQEHRSGWEPEDFSTAWSFCICEKFHGIDFKGEPLERPFGAFYAIRDLEGKTTPAPGKVSDIRRLLPSELEVHRLQREAQLVQNDYNMLLNSRGVRMVFFFKKIIRFLGLARLLSPGIEPK
ncbi:MAG: methyltransferase domain-containing protein [Elusimicrobia bacterium]|nr:methyltransferase domain-containing protein [Elusimicrobiota bacterium]